MSTKPIWIGNDHGGFDLKCEIVSFLNQRNLPVHDVGCQSSEIVRYPYYASQVCNAIGRGDADRGILICSSGIGMSIIANRHRGIRASLCTSTYMGRITRSHNDSNVLCLGGKVAGVFEALDILEAWLRTPYEGGRHSISLQLIEEAEERLCSGMPWAPTDPMHGTP